MRNAYIIIDETGKSDKSDKGLEALKLKYFGSKSYVIICYFPLKAKTGMWLLDALTSFL